MNDDSTALVVAAAPRADIMLPVGSPRELLSARSARREAIVQVLQPGVDIIRVPGTDKDCLSKAGAETVLFIFGCSETYEIIAQEVDHDRVFEFPSSWVDTDEKPSKAEAEELKRKKVGRWRKKGDDFIWQVRGEGTEKVFGLYRFIIRARIIKPDGSVLAEALGSCSTLESKYCSRPRDLENTVLKMAQKRAFVGAVLHGFGLSDRFTQDMDEAVNDDDDRGGWIPPAGGAETSGKQAAGRTMTPTEKAKAEYQARQAAEKKGGPAATAPASEEQRQLVASRLRELEKLGVQLTVNEIVGREVSQEKRLTSLEAGQVLARVASELTKAKASAAAASDEGLGGPRTSGKNAAAPGPKRPTFANLNAAIGRELDRLRIDDEDKREGAIWQAIGHDRQPNLDDLERVLATLRAREPNDDPP